MFQRDVVPITTKYPAFRRCFKGSIKKCVQFRNVDSMVSLVQLEES